MIGLILAGIILAGIVFFQIRSYDATKSLINEYASFFPDITQLKRLDTFIDQWILSNPDQLDQFATDASQDGTAVVPYAGQDGANVSLVSSYGEPVSERFAEVLHETNLYLCKNVDTAADFSILQDICEKKLAVLDNQINSRLNAPLYFGLAGTFIGIIVGVVDLAFNSALGTGSSIASLKPLLFGVGMAMIASFLGLFLMLHNTFGVYGRKSATVETQKNSYFSFLRQELMPTLNNTLSASLNAVKEVLGRFVGEFGGKLSEYSESIKNFKDSYDLLDQNLDKQKQILDQIDSLGTVEMTRNITRSFKALSDASDALDTFKSYQQSINGIIASINSTAQSFNGLMTKFKDFADNTTEEGIFKPWRNSYDALTDDAQKVSTELQKQLSETTRYIQDFAQNNNGFFMQMNDALKNIAEYARQQSSCYEDFRKELLASRQETMELNRQILTFLKDQTRTNTRTGISYQSGRDMRNPSARTGGTNNTTPVRTPVNQSKKPSQPATDNGKTT